MGMEHEAQRAPLNLFIVFRNQVVVSECRFAMSHGVCLILQALVAGILQLLQNSPSWTFVFGEMSLPSLRCCSSRLDGGEDV